ncbi:MAG: hypothetical protein ACE5JH_05430 [Acidobacteriota bacterium]
MKVTGLVAPPSRLLIASSIAFLSAFAFPTPARAVGDWVGFEAAPWLQDLQGRVAIDDGSVQGTTADLQETLDLDDRTGAPQGRLWFRLGKNRLIVDYADSSRDGTQTLTQSLTFNGTTFVVSEDVSTALDMRFLQAQYRYTFLDLKLVEFGGGLGLNVVQFDMDVVGSTAGSSALYEDIPYPSANLAVVVKPLPGFRIRGEVNGISATVSGTSVDVFDARIQMEYYFAHSFGVFAGYRDFDFDVDSGDFGAVDVSFEGVYLGLGLKF